MTLNSYYDASKKVIAATGGFLNGEEISEFFECFNDDNAKIYEITFFDINFLPAEVIDFLASFPARNADKKVKIYSFSRALYSYLNRIGCLNFFIPRKDRFYFDISKSINFLAIGGSAQSSDKIFKIIERFPKSDKTIFVVQHANEDGSKSLKELLQKKTDYSVKLPSNGDSVEKRTIYIAPGGYHMLVKEGRFLLVKDEPYNFARPSIDRFFYSAGEEYGSDLAAVLLCGYGDDGVESLRALKEKGSMVLIEEPMECDANVLPIKAVRNGFYHDVLTIENMTRLLFHIFSENEDIEEHLERFLEDIYQKYGYDLREFEKESLKRRVRSYMGKNHISEFNQFEVDILEKPEVFEEFFLDLGVNVTSFFRDSQVYKTLREEILPSLEPNMHIKIWCAGCSTGEEPYSVAILLHELGLLHKSRIYATDWNEHVVFQAMNGLFPKTMLRDDIDNYVQAGGSASFTDYFDLNENYIKIKEFLKERILFFRHSLTDRGVLNEFNLILCRNVMIYFDKKLQLKVFELFHKSLEKDGFLVLGKSEKTILNDARKYFKAFDQEAAVFKYVMKGD